MAILLMAGTWIAVSVLMLVAWSLYRRSFSGSSLESYDEQVSMLLHGSR